MNTRKEKISDGAAAVFCPEPFVIRLAWEGKPILPEG